MEPERKIEKLLRALAEKRKADAGDFKMHPATRRLLHGEVARRRPARRREMVTWQWIRMWLPPVFKARLLWLLPAVIVIAATVLWPSLSKGRKQGVIALNNLDQSAVSSREVLPLAAAPAMLRDAAGAPVLETAPAPAPSRFAESGLLAKDGETDLAKLQVVAGESAQKKNDKMGTASAPLAVDKERADLKQTVALAEPAQNFGALNSSQAASGTTAQNLFQNAIASAKVAPVLARFQFQQNGSDIAVVDEDGSVYKGQIVNEAGKLKALEPVAKASRALQSPAVSAFTQKPDDAPQRYFFKVAGTNRSLQQSVVFNGSLQKLGDAAQTILSGPGAGSMKNAAQDVSQRISQQGLILNSKIAGTAVLNDTNEIEINASPVMP